MCLLFESIRIEDGIIHHLNLHQKRVNRSLNDSNRVNLLDFSKRLNLPSIGVHKLRITYNNQGIIDYSMIPYIYKDKIKSFELVEHNSIDYSNKYNDRSAINQLLSNSKADEIIIVKNNCITDSSIANIAFSDQKNWYTPSTPLLKGTQREHLLDKGILKTTTIERDFLNRFSHFKLINALNPFEGCATYPIELISNL